MIAAAAKAGCEYFVIDAGWYAELHEDWSQTIGAWQPSKTRFPHGLKFLARSDQASWDGSGTVARARGCRSQVAARAKAGQLVLHASRQTSVEKFAVSARFPQSGGTRLPRSGDGKTGTTTTASATSRWTTTLIRCRALRSMPTASARVLLEHNRAHLAWLEEILKHYPDLVIENCGSGGGRMDYAMLSRLQIQSMTDQENYLKLPVILVGASAAVLPEQLAIWSYPLANADADQASFNMVTACCAAFIRAAGSIHSLPKHWRRLPKGSGFTKKFSASTFPRQCRSILSALLTSPIAPRPLLWECALRNRPCSAVWRIDGPAVTKVPWTVT